MNEKNFYSFYKLNDEETAKFKEEISENNIMDSETVSPVPEKPVRKKSIAVAVALSAVIFAGGIFVGVKFIPDRNSGNNSNISESETIATEEIKTEKATTTKKTESATEKANTENNVEKLEYNEFKVNIPEKYNSYFWLNDGVSAEVEGTDNGFKVNVNEIDSKSLYYGYAVKVYYDDIELSKGAFYRIDFNHNVSYDYSSFCAFSIYQKNELCYSGWIANQEFSECYTAYFTLPESDDNITLVFYFECKVDTPYTIEVSDISISSCKPPDDFVRFASDGQGYYDKDNNYHKYEG